MVLHKVPEISHNGSEMLTTIRTASLSLLMLQSTPFQLHGLVFLLHESRQALWPSSPDFHWRSMSACRSSWLTVEFARQRRHGEESSNTTTNSSKAWSFIICSVGTCWDSYIWFAKLAFTPPFMSAIGSRRHIQARRPWLSFGQWIILLFIRIASRNSTSGVSQWPPDFRVQLSALQFLVDFIRQRVVSFILARWTQKIY